VCPGQRPGVKMIFKLFVYGTLRSQFDNRFARLLRAGADLLGPGTVPGSIYRVRHFPAYRPDPPGEVHGELYRVTDPEKMFAALDDYEGVEFERVVVNGAWIYQYKVELPPQSRIASGDFCAP
jgi:gamma-glutamylcyclotransferase (GGCT)/AIG2-like uncharacterized protein YtfP